MGFQISTNKPDRPVPGEALMRGSVAGRKTRFVNGSDIGSATFTLAAGAQLTLTLNLNAWPPDLSTDARSINNHVSWSDCVGWAYEEFYVDSYTTANYIGNDGLSADQKLVVVHKLEQISPNTYSGSTAATATTRYIIINGGSSSHTIYFLGQYKLIIYGDEIL